MLTHPIDPISLSTNGLSILSMSLQSQVKANLFSLQREIKRLESEKRPITPLRAPIRPALADCTNDPLASTKTRELKREVQAKDAIITGLHSRIEGLKAQIQVYKGEKPQTLCSSSLGRPAPPVLLKERKRRLLEGSFEHYFRENLARTRETN